MAQQDRDLGGENGDRDVDKKSQRRKPACQTEDDEQSAEGLHGGDKGAEELRSRNADRCKPSRSVDGRIEELEHSFVEENAADHEPDKDVRIGSARRRQEEFRWLHGWLWRSIHAPIGANPGAGWHDIPWPRHRISQELGCHPAPGHSFHPHPKQLRSAFELIALLSRCLSRSPPEAALPRTSAAFHCSRRRSSACPEPPRAP